MNATMNYTNPLLMLIDKPLSKAHKTILKHDFSVWYRIFFGAAEIHSGGKSNQSNSRSRAAHLGM